MNRSWPDVPLDLRQFLRECHLVRRELLVDRLPDIEFLKDSFLEDNDFNRSSIFVRWAKKDYEELENIDRELVEIERIDGPVPKEMLDKVQQKLKKLEEEFPNEE